MVNLLKFIGGLSIVCGLVAGILEGRNGKLIVSGIGRVETEFSISTLLTWTISGIISGILFFALAIILERVSDMHYRVYDLHRQANNESGNINTKASLGALSGYKMSAND